MNPPRSSASTRVNPSDGGLVFALFAMTTEPRAAGDLRLFRDDPALDAADRHQVDRLRLLLVAPAAEAELLPAQAGGGDDDGIDLLGEERREHRPAAVVGDGLRLDPLGQPVGHREELAVEDAGLDAGAGDRPSVRAADEEHGAGGLVEHHRDGPIGRQRLAEDPAGGDQRPRPIGPEDARLGPAPGAAGDLQTKPSPGVRLGLRDDPAPERAGIADREKHPRPRRGLAPGIDNRPGDHDRRRLLRPLDEARTYRPRPTPAAR